MSAGRWARRLLAGVLAALVVTAGVAFAIRLAHPGLRRRVTLGLFAAGSSWQRSRSKPMAKRVPKSAAIVGAADHGGWAVLVTVARGGTFIDRRRVELIDGGLPALPHHHEGQGLPIGEAVALVERVRTSANACAAACLDALAAAVPVMIEGIALRTCPPLPGTVAERITDYRAQCVADWVMYREALAKAAGARGWFVEWYDARRVFDAAAKALRRKSIDGLLAETGETLGPPWQKDHKTAMAAAIAASVRKQ